MAILTSAFYQQVEEEGKGPDRIIYGGAERYLVELCRLLRDLGHQVQVFQPWRGDVVVQKQYRDMPVALLPAQDSWSFHVAPNLNMAFNDLATGFDLRVYFAPFLCWPEVRRPAIMVSHGVYWDLPHGAYGRATEEQRREFLRRNLYGFWAADAVVSVDANTRNVVAALEPGAESRIVVIPNAVDTEAFRPRVGPRTWTRVRVLFPRRLVNARGFAEFLQAAQELRELEFWACGQAAAGDAEEGLQALIEHGDLPNVRLEWRLMEGMAEVYQQVDMAVIPSRAAEGTSLSCLEAMASGLPVIVTPVGGLPELVIHGYNGLVIQPTAKALVEAVWTLAESEEARVVMGQRGRDMAVAAFSIERWRLRWADVVDRVLKGG